MSTWSLTYQQSVFERHRSDKHFSEFSTYTMAAKINRGIKLRHCHPAHFRSACPSSIQLVPRVDLNGRPQRGHCEAFKDPYTMFAANQKWFAPSCVGLSVRLSVRLRCRKLGYDTSAATRMQNICPPAWISATRTYQTNLTITATQYINLYSPRNGSNTKKQQYKHKYKQNESKDQVYHRYWHFVLKHKHNVLYNHLYSPSWLQHTDTNNSILTQYFNSNRNFNPIPQPLHWYYIIICPW